MLLLHLRTEPQSTRFVAVGREDHCCILQEQRLVDRLNYRGIEASCYYYLLARCNYIVGPLNVLEERSLATELD